MLARAAIRDVGRVLGHSYGEVDRIAKAVPNQLGIKLDEALEISPQLREQVDGDPAVKRIIGFARSSRASRATPRRTRRAWSSAASR
jgi:DNA polymerase-3 subunit alpha